MKTLSREKIFLTGPTLITNKSSPPPTLNGGNHSIQRDDNQRPKGEGRQRVGAAWRFPFNSANTKARGSVGENKVKKGGEPPSGAM